MCAVIRVGERLIEIGDARFEAHLCFVGKLRDDRVKLARHELEVGEDVRERIVDLVPHTGREDADGRHAIHLDHRGGDLVALREIARDDDSGERSLEDHVVVHDLDADSAAVLTQPALLHRRGTPALGRRHRARGAYVVCADDRRERLTDDRRDDTDAQPFDGLRVGVDDAALAMDHDEVGRRLDDETEALLCLLASAVGAPSLRAQSTVAELARDGRNEPREVVLQQVVVRARTHDLDGGVLADRARHHDERQIRRVAPHDLERGRRVEMRHRVVGEDDVPAPREHGLEIRCSLHAFPDDVELRALDLAKHERSVVVRVLDEEEPEWFRLRAHRSASTMGV